MKLKLTTKVLALAGALALPMATVSASDIYITPKLNYGATLMKGVTSYYHGWGGGVNERLGTEWDDSFGLSLAAGYDFSEKFNQPVRTELEYATFTKAETSPLRYPTEYYKQSHQVRTLFMNVYYDINTNTKFTPYIGAGLGAGFVKTKGFSYSEPIDSKYVTKVAWNVGIGVGYQLADNLTLDVSYRFTDLGRVKTKAVGWFEEQMLTKDLYQHNIGIGVRIGF